MAADINLGERVGINKVLLSPSSLMQTLVISSTSAKLSIYNTLSWQEQYSFDHSLPQLNDRNTGELLNIYRECDNKQEGIFYEALSRPYEVQNKNTQNSAARGITLIAISPDSKFLASKSTTSPNCVWIWDLNEYNLNSILIQHHEVTDLIWCPKSNNLNISTEESSRLYLWSPKGASVC